MPASGLHGSEFETYPKSHNPECVTALEAEHSRDLYLKGAMAVGEIARLLEELCADFGEIHSNAGVEEAAVDEPPIYAPDVMGTPRFMSRDKHARITAWACAVSLADDIDCELHQPCDEESMDLEDSDAIYLRGACVVGDIADLLGSLVQSFTDEEVECEETSSNQQEVAVALLPELSTEIRPSSMSARPAILETDIDEVSQERSDTLKQIELDDTAQDKAFELPGRSQVIEHIGGNRDDDSTDTPSVGEANDVGLLISRFWAMTDTTTSGSSLVTPSGSEVQSLSLEFLKGNFWSSSNQQEVAVAPLPELSRETRLSSLSARLAILETDIDQFSQERSATLKQIELDDIAQDKAFEQPGRSQVIEHVGGNRDDTGSTDTQSVGDDGLLISRFWTMTDTTTSGYSLATSSGSGFQSLSLEFLKGNLWSLNV